jgi:nucleotide-binding universal stress UspA family protein/CBS domain-containing protein
MKVLLATDGSPCSWHALEEARRVLPLEQAEVTLVAVAARPQLRTDPIGYDLAYEPVMRENRREARRTLDSAKRMLETAGVAARPQLREGDPATELMAVANEVQPDVIVVGSHGRGPVGRFWLGSVSDALVHRWPGAVMVVRLPAAASPASGRTVGDVMTVRPVCIDAARPLDDAAQLMRDHDMGFAPEVKGGLLEGVIPDRDIVVRALASSFNPATTPVVRFCTRPAVWVAPEMPVEDAAALMERHHIRRVVVMDGQDIVGVVSLGDLAESLPRLAEHALAEISRSKTPHP